MKKADLEKAILEFKKMKFAMSAMEQKIKPIKEAIEAEVAKAPEKQIIIGGHKLALVAQSRETISVKEAKAVLGDVLDPFIKISHFNQLRVS